MYPLYVECWGTGGPSSVPSVLFPIFTYAAKSVKLLVIIVFLNYYGGGSVTDDPTFIDQIKVLKYSLNIAW